jgi:hypothetical protein
MYKPARPVVVGREPGDCRPIMSNILSGRMNPKKIAEGDYVIDKYGDDLVIYFKPYGGPRPPAKED